MRKITQGIALVMALSLQVSAHDFYVNITAPLEAKPWSATTSIGWGHTLPFEDFFAGSNLQSYTLHDPNMKRMELKFDKNNNVEAVKLQRANPAPGFPSAVVVGGDGYLNRLFFNDQSALGVYQVAAVSEPLHFAEWIDEKGREKWGRKYLDEIRDAREIRSCRSFQSFAKAYLSYGEWKTPKPIGHELELIPLSDLSKVKVGDVVEFEVLFQGQGLDEMNNGVPAQIRAYGEQNVAGFSGAFVEKGKARFQVNSAGKWIAVISLNKPVSEKIAPELVGKALHKGYNASVTFFVKER